MAGADRFSAFRGLDYLSKCLQNKDKVLSEEERA